MNWESVAYSAAGLAIGYLLGRYVRLNSWSEIMRFIRTKEDHVAEDTVPYDPHAAVPAVIPEVRWTDDGEPIIAKEEVHHPSPVPRSIAIVLLILAALSVAYNAVQQVQRNNENARHNRELSRQVTANKALLDKYGRQQAVIDGNEQRLEDLVLAISTARTPQQVTLAIQRFLKDSAKAHQQEQEQQQPQQQHSAYSPTPTPAPDQSRKSQSTSSPSPKSSRSSSPSPSSGTQICVQGIGCVTPTPLPTIFRVENQIHSKPISAPGTQESFPWWAVLSIVAFTVGAGYLVSRRHDDPL